MSIFLVRSYQYAHHDLFVLPPPRIDKLVGAKYLMEAMTERAKRELLETRISDLERQRQVASDREAAARQKISELTISTRKYERLVLCVLGAFVDVKPLLTPDAQTLVASYLAPCDRDDERLHRLVHGYLTNAFLKLDDFLNAKTLDNVFGSVDGAQSTVDKTSLAKAILGGGTGVDVAGGLGGEAGGAAGAGMEGEKGDGAGGADGRLDGTTTGGGVTAGTDGQGGGGSVGPTPGFPKSTAALVAERAELSDRLGLDTNKAEKIQQMQVSFSATPQPQQTYGQVSGMPLQTDVVADGAGGPRGAMPGFVRAGSAAVLVSSGGGFGDADGFPASSPHHHHLHHDHAHHHPGDHHGHHPAPGDAVLEKSASPARGPVPPPPKQSAAGPPAARGAPSRKEFDEDGNAQISVDQKPAPPSIQPPVSGFGVPGGGAGAGGPPGKPTQYGSPTHPSGSHWDPQRNLKTDASGNKLSSPTRRVKKVSKAMEIPNPAYYGRSGRVVQQLRRQGGSRLRLRRYKWKDRTRD